MTTQPTQSFSLLAARATPARPARPENRFGLDYRLAAELLPRTPTPIVDIHTHLNGPGAAWRLPAWRAASLAS